MSKSAWVGIVVIVLVLIGGGLWFANKNSNDKGSTNSTNSSTSTNTNSSSESNNSSSGSAAPTATDAVSIKDMAFTPADITVKAGTTVTWTNNDSVAHTVTETDSQTGPNSGNLEPGKTFTFTYSAAGTYKYHCSIHPNMTGTVTVTS